MNTTTKYKLERHFGNHKELKLNTFYNFYNKIIDLVLLYLFYPVFDFYNKYLKRIKRSIAYAKFGWTNHDHDSMCLFSLMSFKLKRLLNTLENGFCLQEKKNIVALKEAIKLCERLYKYDYEDNYYKAHNKKWGKRPIMKTEPVKNENGEVTMYKAIFKNRKNVKTKEDKKQEYKDFLDLHKKAKKDKNNDYKKLCDIFIKHAESWWD